MRRTADAGIEVPDAASNEPLALRRDSIALHVLLREVAQKHYGARGWVLHHNFDLWRGTAPINASNHGIWVTGGAWLCMQLWDHYLFTLDREFLRNRAYPIMKEAALFFTDFLVADPLTGWLISGPSNSPELGGLVMGQLGIQMIPAYSPQARGRSERAFATHQERLPRELARARIRTPQAANRYLEQRYRSAFNTEFAVKAAEPGTAFVPFIGPELKEILCEHHERTVGADNCVRFEGLTLQIPVQQHRCHYVKAKVRVHRYSDASLALFHGPRCLARFDARGQLKTDQPKELAA